MYFLVLSLQQALSIFSITIATQTRKAINENRPLKFMCPKIQHAWRPCVSPVCTSTIRLEEERWLWTEEASNSLAKVLCVLHNQHRHYCKVTVCIRIHKQGNLHHRVLPSCPADGPAARRTRDTLTAPHVWLKTDRSWACRSTHCGRSGLAGSSAFPLRSYGDTPGPGSALSLSEPSRQREHRESSRPRRTLPGTQHAAEEESTTG